MTTDEHLDAIVARCTELLAIAEKRTQGYWFTDDNLDSALIAPEDVAFIAACGDGNAEAGWKTTIEAIKFVKRHNLKKGLLIQYIIAVWPPETLNQ